MGAACQYNTCRPKSESKQEVLMNVSQNIVDQIQSDFIVTQENENINDQLYGTISILEPKKEALQGFKLALKMMKYNEKDDFAYSLQMYENRFYGLNHPNLLIIHAMQNHKVDEFFGTEYVISLYMDYPSRTFQRELIFRQRSWFSEDEILYFLDSTVGALAFLQSKGLSHKDLSFESIYVVTLMTGRSCIKINDPLMKKDGTSAFERHLYQSEAKTDFSDYFSPEQISVLRLDEKQQYNEYKSDVFTLGMLVLELCTLSKCSHIYNKQNLTIDEDVLQNQLLKVADRYSEGLYELIKIMVFINVKKRPDFFELDELISSTFIELTNRRIGQTWQYSDYQYCIQDGFQKNQSITMLRKNAQPLIHPDLHSKSSGQNNPHTKKTLTIKRTSQRQLSSIRQNFEQGQQSNLSIFEASSPQLSRKELYGPQISSKLIQKGDSLLNSYCNQLN